MEGWFDEGGAKGNEGTVEAGGCIIEGLDYGL